MDSPDGFHHLGNNILLHPGTSSAERNGKSDAPSIIVLCTWLGGASARRIAKYTSTYRQIYPTSPILLIRTVFMDLAARPAFMLRRRMIPAAWEISRHIKSPDDGILLHVFSNGGANMAVQLAAAIKSAIPLGVMPASPFRMVIFDCCPCFTSFKSQYDAAAFSLPNSQPANALGQMVLVPFVGTVAMLQNMGVVASGLDLHKDLNHRSVFGTAPLRLYLYSMTDKTVPYQDVEIHKDNAQRKGYRVHSTKFDTAPHCGLVVADSTKYWKAIQQAWGVANRDRAVVGSVAAKL